MSGASPSGYTLVRHPPVAETLRVVAARSEPPVVEDEPLDAEIGSRVGECLQPVGVVVEVHRFPRVEQRPDVAGSDGRRERAATVELPGRGGQPVGEYTDTSGVVYDSPGSSTTSPGCSSSPLWR